MAPKIYKDVLASRPGRSVFNLSYSKIFTCDMGELYPIMHDEVVPGDVLTIGNEIMIRFQPLVAPVLHEIYVTVHYFFVPYRLICKHDDVAIDWEAFISGGKLGADATVLPVWNPVSTAVGSLWDAMGMPIGIDNANARPLAFPQIAYNMIFNEFYMDENVDTALVVDVAEAIQNGRWEKDYFTSALPWQQRGTAPAMPVTLSGYATVEGVNADITIKTEADADPEIIRAAITTGYLAGSAPPAATGDIRWVEPSLRADLSGGSATTFDVEDLRLAIRIQQWMERNARAGYRYIELLKAHFGVSPRDDRLDRPEYIGGSKGPVIISEVLQTSSTDVVTPQGNMAGHGIAVQRNFCAKLRVEEFGIVMGIMCVRPKAMYHQGINRQWLRETRYDFYWPEFAGLSEQAIETREIYCDGANELDVFGYQGRYDEMRTKPNLICGDMHSDFDHWHLCRQFAAQPTLDAAFMTCTPRKDIFAAPAEDGLLVNFGNIIKAVRPIPYMAQPQKV